MALSKLPKNRTIPDEGIESFCVVKQLKPTTIELMDHLIGGPNMEYLAMELENCWECYDFLKKQMMLEVESAMRYYILKMIQLQTRTLLHLLLSSKANMVCEGGSF